MRSDYCFRCGSNPFDSGLDSGNDLDFDNDLDIQFSGDENICKHCGETLWGTCLSCNGTGKALNLSTSSFLNRCDQCRRPLRRRVKSAVCVTVQAKEILITSA